MNERKLLVDTNTRDTMSSGLQHSEDFTSLTLFIGKIKIEHFSFLRWLINFDSHCISFNGLSVFNEDSAKQKSFQAWLKTNNELLSKIVFETNFPYLKPVDLSKEVYNPINGILRIALFFVDTIRKRGLHATKLVQISNKNSPYLFNIE